MPNPQLIIDLASATGAVKHGAAGFLYGLGNAGIPSVNLLAPLKPQVAAQKPEGGGQHPNGDALDVSDTYRAAGGKEIEIYLQDIYPDWPYPYLGFEDYLQKVEGVVRQTLASPNRSLFAYVPFNEPDQIWYNTSDKKQAFFADWQRLYQNIKALDPAARIVGPNFARYDSAVYKDFLTFAQRHHCLPEVISWHELEADFFAAWYERYADYRNSEARLGIPAREICINEYGRRSGDLGLPGQLVQWIARFENSKVDACLAYWTTAGCLDDLVTRDNYNQATGAWWLYKWYGDMTGHTVKVTPPEVNAEGLQGLASLDRGKKQVRILLGGASGHADVIVKGFGAAPYLGHAVHLAVWAAAATGTRPSPGPVFVMEGDYAVAAGQIAVTVNAMVGTTAYQVIVTPVKALASARPANRYKAEVERYDASRPARTVFVVTAGANGFYNVRLRYAAGPGAGAPATRTLRMLLDDSPLKAISVPATAGWSAWADMEVNVFLTAGINRIALDGLADGPRMAVAIDYIEVTPGSGLLDTYEAEAPGNTLAGTAEIIADPAASGGQCVGRLGNGPANTLQFNTIYVAESGIYRMAVYFANAEHRGSHDYNIQVVDRYADISVNAAAAQRVYFRNTFAWNVYQSRVVDVHLRAGNNTVKFSNPAAYLPNIDRIQVAARY